MSGAKKVCIAWLALSYVLFFAAVAQAGNAGANLASYGHHGMVLFGGQNALFASHLPMFHAPHDAQVVLEIDLGDAKIAHALRAALQARPRLWTLNPEAFALSDLSSGKISSFQADLVRGHFERGGKVVYEAVQVRVKRVIFHAVLSALYTTKSFAYYQIIAIDNTAFMFKHIDQRPDFDHIVGLVLNGEKSLTKTTPIVLKLPITGAEQPSSERLQTMLDQAGVAAKVAEQVYFETGDLR
jgi:hypothetical protein